MKYATFELLPDFNNGSAWEEREGENWRLLQERAARERFEPKVPRFAMVSCSGCGKGFGPGDCGFSRCEDHAALTVVDD